MARCNECPACKIVLDYRIANRGKRKLIKACERSNKCINPSQGSKKRRINELESLHAAGHGGQIRGEYGIVPSAKEMELNRAARTSRPKEFIPDSLFDEQAYKEYEHLVIECTNVARESTSDDVKLESKSMIPKMRKLLNPRIKAEVDYIEAARDGSNILVEWAQGRAAGTRAFIPDPDTLLWG